MHDDISLPGVSAADLGGPEGASLAQAAQDLKREKNRDVGQMLGEQERSLGAGLRRSDVFGPTVPRIQARIEVKRHDPRMQASNLRPSSPLDKQDNVLGVSALQRRERYEPGGFERREGVGHEAMLAGAGIRWQLPVNRDIKSLDSSRLHSPSEPSIRGTQDAKNCGAPADLSELLGINPSDWKVGKHVGCKNLPAQGEDVRSNVFSPVQRQAGMNPLSAPANSPDINGPRAQDQIRRNDGFQRYDRVIPDASRTQSLGVPLTGEEQEVGSFTQEAAKHLSEAEHLSRKSKPLRMPEQTERNAQASSKSKLCLFHHVLMIQVKSLPIL